MQNPSRTEPDSSRSRPRPFRRAGRLAFAAGDLVVHVLGHVERLVSEVTRDSRSVAGEAVAFWSDARAMGPLLAAELGRVQSSLRGFPRAARLVGEVARLLAVYRLRGAGDATHAEGARRVHDLCVELRGGVLKIGQLASCRVDLLPPAYVAELARLQDRVPPLSAEVMRARIEAELGKPIAELFAAFDDTPLAAASIAQVHAARLPDGTEVVVKVQLPGVEDAIAADLAALRVIAALFAERLPGMDVETIVAELSRSVRAELDFLAEADATEAVRAAFAGDAGIVVPRVHRELCTRRVLVLERLPAVSLTRFLDEAAPADRDVVLQTLARAYAAQILAHGRFQADAHPGNFMVLTEGATPRLGLIDFGATRTLPAEVRRAYVALTAAILAGDAPRMAEQFRVMGFATADGDPTTLEHFAELMLGAFKNGADLSAIDPAAQMATAFKLARENPVVRLPEEFVLIGRVFASLGGLFLRYQPKLSLYAAIAPFVMQAAAR